MPTTARSDLGSYAQEVRSTASDVTAIVVAGCVEVPEHPALATVHLDPDDALRAIQHLRPRIVYMLESQLNLESAALQSLEDLQDEADERGPLAEPVLMAGFSELKRKWQSHEGDTSSIIVEFVADGILHTTIALASWRDEFDANLEAILEGVREQSAQAMEADRDVCKHRVQKNAATLIAHPSFSAGRPSFEKRLFLAETLFPDLDAQELQEVTSHAEKLAWLSKPTTRS